MDIGKTSEFIKKTFSKYQVSTWRSCKNIVAKANVSTELRM